MRKVEHQILLIKKQIIKKILKCDCYIKNADTKKIQQVKQHIKKQGTRKIVKNK